MPLTLAEPVFEDDDVAVRLELPVAVRLELGVPVTDDDGVPELLLLGVLV